MKTSLTIKDVIEAAEKNGFPWRKQAYGSEHGACLVGQAALNLNVSPSLLDDALWQIVQEDASTFVDKYGRHWWITDYNDREAVTYENAVAHMKEIFAGKESEIIEIVNYDE